MPDPIRFRSTFAPDEYFAIDDGSDERHEYFEGYILAKPDEAYDVIPIVRQIDAAMNTSEHIRERLGNPDADRLQCDPGISNGHLAQPILYGPHLGPAGKVVPRSIPNRTFIVELQAPAAERDQLALYREAEGLADYVLVSQRRPHIQVWTRRRAGFDHRAYLGLDAVVPIASLDIRLLAGRVYADVAASLLRHDE